MRLQEWLVILVTVLQGDRTDGMCTHRERFIIGNWLMSHEEADESKLAV